MSGRTKRKSSKERGRRSKSETREEKTPRPPHSCCLLDDDKKLIAPLLKQHKAYLLKLPRNQQRSIAYYQDRSLDDEDDIINFYTGEKDVYLSWNVLNEYLRDLIDKRDRKKLAPSFDSWTRDLNHVIHQAPKSKHTIHVYRGISDNSFLSDLKVGARVEWKGFTSTAWELSIPYQYMGKGNMIPNPKWVKQAKKHGFDRVMDYWKNLLNRGKSDNINRLDKELGPIQTPDLKDPWKSLIRIEIPPGASFLMPHYYAEQHEVILPHPTVLEFLGKQICELPWTDPTIPVRVETFCFRLIVDETLP